VSDGSEALFLRGFFAYQKKAGTYSTTRSFYEGARPNELQQIVKINYNTVVYSSKKIKRE
jgi:hypothetical protein